MSERDEPKAIEGLRHSVLVLTGFGGDIPLDDVTVADMRDILAAYDALRSERDEARREREALREEMQHDDTIINGQAALLTGVANVLHGEPEPLTMHSHHDLPELVLALRQRAERMERVVEAAKAYEKWMGKWHDYTKTTGDVPHKVEAALINAVRAAVAAKTTTNTEDTIV